MRMTFDAADPHEIKKSGDEPVDRSRGAAKAITVSCAVDRWWRADDNGTQGFIDPGLKWADIPWFKSITKGDTSPSAPPISTDQLSIKVPLILKGVQTWEDALEAYDQNLAGVVLSNHGGRQLDFARSGIEVLVEVVEKFKEKRGITFPNDRFQLFVDGGVRRATDVLKAVALGATAGA
jgi:L-lactate dehydrogenase (cytochrome)